MEDDKTINRGKKQQAPRPLGFYVSWPTVAITSAILALATVGTLVVTTTVSNADVLATVALVLAILSFGAQLIVTAAQSMSANEQYRQANRIYQQTSSVLAKIRAQSDAVLSNQRDQFDKVLNHVLSPSNIESAVAEAVGEEQSEEGSEKPDADAVAKEVAKLLQEQATRAFETERLSTSPRIVAEQSRRRLESQKLDEFPSEAEAAEALKVFKTLSRDAREYMKAQARTALKTPYGVRTRLPISMPMSQLPERQIELADAGLFRLEHSRHDGKDRTIRTITDLGMTVVRFFTASGIVPEYLADILSESKE